MSFTDPRSWHEEGLGGVDWIENLEADNDEYLEPFLNEGFESQPEDEEDET
jgi:hypothetical protein